VWLLGVDGGGSHTACWVADESGRVRGRGEAGPCNLGSVGPEAAEANLGAAARAAMAQAGVRPADVAASCFGLAGFDRPGDRAALQAMALRLGLTGSLRIENDAVIAWAGGCRARPGAVVLAGTGSIAYGRTGDGRSARAGGWGPLFGDEGSGFTLGRRAVTAALQGADGRGPATALAALLCRGLDIPTIEDAVSAIRWHDADPARVAALAPLVLRAAAGGDAVALDILTQAADGLAEMAVAVLARLGLHPAAALVVAGGSLLGEDTPLRRRLDAALRRRGVAGGARAPLLAPVAGALLLAWATLGGNPDTWTPGG
jgi:N-acetylglucosamine kinase-like BadF-type ATPase